MFQNNIFSRIFSLTVFIGTAAIFFTVAGDVKQAVSYSVVSENIEALEDCGIFSLELPEDTVLYGMEAEYGRFLPYPIDDSGDRAKVFDIAVNSPQQPAVLFLETYGPAVWNIQWTKGTEILGVVAFGVKTQAVAGLPESIPTVTNTLDKCGQKNAIINRIARGTNIFD